jgi:hypothetical protein
MAAMDNAAISAIKFDELGAAPSTPAANDWKLYFKASGLFIIDDAGVELGPLGLAMNANRIGIISPAQLVINTDDWAPTNLSTAAVIRLNTDAARDITGIVAQAAATRILLCNIGAFNAVLKHDVTSTAANRFYGPGSADFTLTPNKSVDIWYDATSSRWRIIG